MTASSLRSVEDGSGADLVVDAVVGAGSFRLAASFAVAAGEVLGVLGPNGAGKTSLLRALAGLAAVSSGRIELGGSVIDDAGTGRFVPAEQRPVGLLFQDYRLFPHLSVRDNVAFAPRCQGRSRQQARQLADQWLGRLGVGGLANRKPAELSGGQAQRVALARSLAADPQLLLLDEPLAALDASTRLEVRAELRRHLSAFAGPVLIVTHDPLEAMVMTDRLLVLEGGRIVQQGTPADIARRPATDYVAKLVGLNLYAGTRSDGGEVALAGGGMLTVAASAAEGAAGGVATGAVLVALRPSAIALHTEPPGHGSPRNVWRGRVAGLELLTDRVRVQVSGTPSALVDITPAAVAELDLVEGTPVWLSAKATELDCYPESLSVDG